MSQSSTTVSNISRSNSQEMSENWARVRDLEGSVVALVTPMKEDDEQTVDYEALCRHIKWQISSRTKGIVVMGTTGENPTMDDDEYVKVVEMAVSYTKEVLASTIPVIAGTGSNSTKATINKTLTARVIGADAALIVVPYYNKPTQEGLIQHFTAVANSCPDFPIILYNVPSRTGCDMLPTTIAKLSKIPNIVAVKEASGKMERYAEIRKLCEPEFKVFIGDDSHAVQAILSGSGASGVVSVAANVLPLPVQMACEAALEKNVDLAKKLNQCLLPLYDALFIEPNPCPVKYILTAEKKIPGGIRLPLVTLSEKNRTHVYDLYKKTAAEAEKICQSLN